MKYDKDHPILQCMMSQSTCYRSTREMEVKGVLWHSTGAANPAIKRYVQPDDNAPDRDKLLDILGVNLYGNDWNHSQRQAGLNAWIGKLADGSVATVQTMPWTFRPWGCGSGKIGSCNNGWIQFEICEDDLTDKEYFQSVYREACELTAYLCRIFEIDPLGYKEVSGVQIPTVLCHQDSYRLGFGSNHSDVLHWFSKFGKTMDDVRKDVAVLLCPPDKNEEPDILPAFRAGDQVYFKGGSFYSNANAKSGLFAGESRAVITQVYKGRHPYHCRAINDAGKYISGVYGWVDEDSICGIGTTPYVPKTGDIVTYHGCTHYSNANAQSGSECVGGLAKITQIYQPGKARHPYHLVHCGPGCTVYGWVDEGSFTKL